MFAGGKRLAIQQSARLTAMRRLSSFFFHRSQRDLNLSLAQHD
jgi:hypothetical protein